MPSPCKYKKYRQSNGKTREYAKENWGKFMLWSRHHSICKNFTLSVRCGDFHCDVASLETSAGYRAVGVWCAAAQLRYSLSRCSLVAKAPQDLEVSRPSECLLPLPDEPALIKTGVLFHLVVPCCIATDCMYDCSSRWSAGFPLRPASTLWVCLFSHLHKNILFQFALMFSPKTAVNEELDA